MKTTDLLQVAGWEVVQPEAPERDVSAGYTSDLLSDVMANAPEHAVWITLQAHANSVAVAALAGISAVLLCHRRAVPADMLAAARREGMLLLRTSENQYEASVRLHGLLSTEPHPGEPAR